MTSMLSRPLSMALRAGTVGPLAAASTGCLALRGFARRAPCDLRVASRVSASRATALAPRAALLGTHAPSADRACGLFRFASTQGGTCAYSKDLYAVPIVITVNYSTANLSFLDTHDWLSAPANRLVVTFTGPGQPVFGRP